ncbi:hypothetical protein KR52_08745 [Synechococcus sp. KORDI-52]|uniref:hypothetical protein n=1 Tax=Synechococcus sp. KORDI-52 TaxID=585425 RepID=UPI0004E04FEC|nr:hypothetical protein [Synechococcus sp. KORDI-52]AII49230.1 hypothetical protein KR52_08745 [Synechococcus sp. KORDI-52]
MSPLLRRVGIYIVLSTAAVKVVNQLELDQANVYPIYIPMFIGIYVISRWIDSRFNQTSQQQQPKSKHRKEPSATSERGFGD